MNNQEQRSGEDASEVVPPELSVYPQQDATAAVIFSPPSDGSALSGLLAYGVLASSTLPASPMATAPAARMVSARASRSGFRFTSVGNSVPSRPRAAA